MNSEGRASLLMLDADALKKLLEEVKETVATGLILPESPKNSFSSVDMWNFRRNVRSASSMIRK